MKMILTGVLILRLTTMPACTAPPNETEADRKGRINGVALDSAIVMATLVFFFCATQRGR